MTSQSPRVYTYKITFEEVPYYYYGVHKEKKFGEYYMGSPCANKWYWDFYTPQKQILEIFPFTNEGWIEAQEIEGRLIRPVFNTDKWCLNAGCMGIFSLDAKSKAGKIGGQKVREFKLGCHSLTPEQKSEAGKIGGTKAYEMKVGIHGRNKEQKSEDSKKLGKMAYELGFGIYGRTPDKIKEDCKKGGNKLKELGLGIHGRTKEQMSEHGKKINLQKWMCLETGYISTPAGLATYQRARGIDTSKKKRIA